MAIKPHRPLFYLNAGALRKFRQLLKLKKMGQVRGAKLQYRKDSPFIRSRSLLLTQSCYSWYKGEHKFTTSAGAMGYKGILIDTSADLLNTEGKRNLLGGILVNCIHSAKLRVRQEGAAKEEHTKRPDLVRLASMGWSLHMLVTAPNKAQKPKPLAITPRKVGGRPSKRKVDTLCETLGRTRN